MLPEHPANFFCYKWIGPLIHHGESAGMEVRDSVASSLPGPVMTRKPSACMYATGGRKIEGLKAVCISKSSLRLTTAGRVPSKHHRSQPEHFWKGGALTLPF